METRRNFLFAYGANRFYQGVSFTEDIYGSEEYPRSVIKLFFIKHLAALTRWIYLSDCPSVKNLIRVNRLQVVLLPCHKYKYKSLLVYKQRHILFIGIFLFTLS